MRAVVGRILDEGVVGDAQLIEQVEELEPDNGAGHLSYSVITGEYTSTPAWESRPVAVGATVEKPTPIFTKLDLAEVEAEFVRA